MDQTYPFKAGPLPFAPASLAPLRDPDAIFLHHSGYYAQKVRELNHLVAKHRLTGLSLEDLLIEDIDLPPAARARRTGAAGAVSAHELYFDGAQAAAGAPPPGRLTAALTETYGSIGRLKRLLLEAAESLPGAGWVWLVAERNGGPHLVVTDNNEVVDLRFVQPLFVLDMWEHAYFLDDQFRKDLYLDRWFSLLDWDKAERRFLESQSGV